MKTTRKFRILDNVAPMVVCCGSFIILKVGRDFMRPTRSPKNILWDKVRMRCGYIICFLRSEGDLVGRSGEVLCMSSRFRSSSVWCVESMSR